ncbi:caspase-8-like protein [Leptotrombidium deliense]|uniref:Caspase-8-like protein n=1 Tax=Leptotrombidium deliense TaxID=299467 RepID=A0A443RX91_9ACAR|nr:caspase-8-like protein [Leptotrombidium deliense]
MPQYDVRHGTNADRDALKSYFEGIGFKVPIPHEDFTVEEIFNTLYEYANNEDNFDCLVCIFLTHGKQDSLAACDEEFEMRLIFTPFSSQNCPKLKGKAKLFFINACQGNKKGNLNVLVKAKNEESDACDVPMVPRDDHFLFCMSTVPGFLGWRHKKKGTFYIQCLVKILNRCGTSEDIHTVLTTVNREMVFKLRNRFKQMPIFWTSLLDKFYFQFENRQ